MRLSRLTCLLVLFAAPACQEPLHQRELELTCWEGKPKISTLTGQLTTSFTDCSDCMLALGCEVRSLHVSKVSAPDFWVCPDGVTPPPGRTTLCQVASAPGQPTWCGLQEVACAAPDGGTDL